MKTPDLRALWRRWRSRRVVGCDWAGPLCRWVQCAGSGDELAVESFGSGSMNWDAPKEELLKQWNSLGAGQKINSCVAAVNLAYPPHGIGPDA